MKKLLLVAICIIAVMLSCKNKGKTEAPKDKNDSLTATIDSIIEENDTTPMPMFLMGYNSKYLQMIYWSQLEEPKKTADNDEWFDEMHQSWALQDMFRRNAAQYTNLIEDDNSITKLKFIDEVLKDPDGNTPSIGEIHGREEIPSLCARFDYANPKDKKEEHGCIVVTDSYLKSRQRLNIIHIDSEWNKPEPLPEAIVKKLEKQYGMKVERMCLQNKIDNEYAWGYLQFKGVYKEIPKDEYGHEHKTALALDVLIHGEEVYVNEQVGYYDDEYGPTWNADDQGEYVGCHIRAAFEGPKGLELCFTRYAPESSTIGMFYIRDEKMICHEYQVYHNLIDEEIPVWKKDFAEMRKLYLDKDPHEHKDIKLTKWAHIYIDYENEWIWLRDKDEKNGAIFLRDKNGKIKLIAVETPRMKPSSVSKNGISYLKVSGTAGGPSMYSQIWSFKDGKQIEEATVLEVYGEVDECKVNGKQLTKEEGKTYFDNIPQGEPINAYFKDIETENKSE